jgi:NAD(P)-dependent dehydrogenase (short-subunit alcohol dehydrogenase family)
MTDSKIMIVTGASRGLGAATARLAARRGYDVCVNYLGNAEGAESVVRDVEAAGRRAITVQADVSKEDQVARLFETVDRELGRVTALVNNNILGVLLCSRAAIRRMSTRHGGKGGGIINLSSVAASLGMGGDYVWYATTKGAIDSLTIGLANEVAREGIRVNAVAPGMVATDIHIGANDPDRPARVAPTIPIGRCGEPEEIAEPILWLLSDGASYATGAILRVGGGR